MNTSGRTRLHVRAIAAALALAVAAILPAVGQRAAAAPASDVPTATAVAYRSQVSLDPDRQWLDAVSTVTLSVSSATSQVTMLLNPALAIQNVTVAGQPAKFTRKDYQITVTLPAKAAPGDIVLVGVDYHGEIISQGWGLRGHIGKEGVFVSREAWLPCDERWTAGAPADLTIDIPTGYTLVNLGSVVAEQNEGGKRQVSLRTTDLNLVAGIYDYRRIATGDAVVDLYTYAAYPDVGRTLADEVPRAFDFLRRTLGGAGIKSLVIVNMPAVPGFGGGVAYQNLIGLVPDYRNARGYDIYSILPHELTHRWQQARLNEFEGPGSLWLTEATAQYVGWLYLADRFGEDRFRDAMSQGAEVYWRDRFIDGTGSVLDFENNPRADLRYGAVYLKGAWALHGFRELVGEQVFADYMRQHLDWRAATLDEWIDRCGDLAGMDVRPYFDSWLRKDEGKPLTAAGLTISDGTLSVTYDPGRHSLTGDAALELHNVLGPRPTIRLSLNTGLTIKAVSVRGEPTPFIQSTRDLVIAPADGFAADESFTVEVSYAGWPVAIGAAPIPASGALPASTLWYPSLTDLTWPGTVMVTLPAGQRLAAVPGWQSKLSEDRVELTMTGPAPAPISLAPARAGYRRPITIAVLALLVAVAAVLIIRRRVR